MVKATVDAHADRAILPTSAILLAAMQEFGRPDAARLPLRARRSRVGAVGAGRSHAACRDCSLGVRCDGLLSLWSRNENKTIKGRRMILLECENCRRRFAVQEAPALTRLLCPYCAKEIIVQSSQRTVDLEAKDDDNSASAPQDLPQSSPACLHAPPRNGSVENARPFLSFLDDYDRGQSPFAKQYRAEQNAWLAALLSLFSGVCLGQFYNGQVLKGVCILAPERHRSVRLGDIWGKLLTYGGCPSCSRRGQLYRRIRYARFELTITCPIYRESIGRSVGAMAKRPNNSGKRHRNILQMIRQIRQRCAGLGRKQQKELTIHESKGISVTCIPIRVGLFLNAPGHSLQNGYTECSTQWAVSGRVWMAAATMAAMSEA